MKAIRYPMTQEALVNHVQDFITDYMKVRARQPKPRDQEVLTDYMSGMELLARSLGVDCTCTWRRYSKMPDTCICRPLTPRERRGRR